MNKFLWGSDDFCSRVTEDVETVCGGLNTQYCGVMMVLWEGDVIFVKELHCVWTCRKVCGGIKSFVGQFNLCKYAFFSRMVTFVGY